MQVFGERVIVVAHGRLARLTEPPAVVGDDTVTGIEQNWELFLPGGTTQWIAMDQYDWFTRTMILVKEINTPRVFLTDNNDWHRTRLPIALFL